MRYNGGSGTFVMNPKRKLALRMALVSLGVLAVAGLGWAVLLIFRAPPSNTPEIVIQRGPSKYLSSVAWNPDGRFLATGSWDTTVTLWDSSTAQLTRTLRGNFAQVNALAWSPDGLRVASVGEDRTVRIWDVSSGQMPVVMEHPAVAQMAIAWSPDGAKLVTGGRDGVLMIWDVGTGKSQLQISAHTNMVRSVAWSGDGKWIASGGDDRMARIFEAASGRLVYNLEGHTHNVTGVAFRRDSGALATSCWDTRIRVWSTASGHLEKTLTGHSYVATSVAWSPDGQRLASGALDRTVIVWDVKSGDAVRTLTGNDSSVVSVAWSPAANQVAAVAENRSIAIWDSDTGQQQHRIESRAVPVNTVVWSPDGATLTTAGFDSAARLWDPKTGNLTRSLGNHAGAVSAVAFRRDGRILATAGFDQTVQLWDLDSGQYLGKLSGHAKMVMGLAWRQDDKTLVSVGDDGAAILWDTQTLREERRLALGDAGGVVAVEFSPDGSVLATAGDDRQIRLWSADGTQLLRTIPAHDGAVLSIAWHPNSRLLASSSVDGTVKLWDSATGTLVRTLVGHRRYVTSVKFSPAGEQIATAGFDTTIKLWNAETGAEVRTITGDLGEILRIAWSPDGKHLAAASYDSRAVVFNPVTGAAEFAVVLEPAGEWLVYNPASLSYFSSPEGDRFAAVRFQGTLRPIYPLFYYRGDLRRANIEPGLSEQPDISPRPVRLKWDALPDKENWLGGLLAFYGVAGLLVFVATRGANVLQPVRRFFLEGGYRRAVEMDSKSLQLVPAEGDLPGYCYLGMPNETQRARLLRLWRRIQSRGGANAPKSFRCYIVFSDSEPQRQDLRGARAEMPATVVPLSRQMIERCVWEGTSHEVLRQIERPYPALIDPFEDFGALHDPNWFVARDSELTALTGALDAGRNVLLVALRKMGKTTLLLQLRNSRPGLVHAWVDPKAVALSGLAHAVLTRIRSELGLKGIPFASGKEAEPLAGEVSRLHRAFTTSGAQGPFVILLDDVEGCLSDRSPADAMAKQAVRELAELLAIGPEKLIVVATAIRPGLNREAVAGATRLVGAFHEIFLIDHAPPAASVLLEELGIWKEIHWHPEALAAVYRFAAGNPMVSRFLASDATRKGFRKQVDEAMVLQAVDGVLRDLERNRVGRHYGMAVWEVLSDTERLVMLGIAGRVDGVLPLAAIPPYARLAVETLLEYGLIQRTGDSLEIPAILLRSWLEQRHGASSAQVFA